MGHSMQLCRSQPTKSRPHSRLNIRRRPAFGTRLQALGMEPLEERALLTVFTSPSTIGAGDLTYEGEDIYVDGTTVTIDGHHDFAAFHVINGGAVTQVAGAAGGLDLAISGDFFV